METNNEDGCLSNTLSRRKFISSGISAIAVSPFLVSGFQNLALNKYKAVAFDAFPIFDSQPVAAAINKLFPEKGNELINQWKTSQFEYTWLRTVAGQYRDFWKVTEDALLFASKKSGITLSDSDKDSLMHQYLQLDIWPDVVYGLKQLKNLGLRLCFLSNMTKDMLTSNIKYSRLETFFDEVISTDQANTYKPDPKAYGLGTQILKLKKEEILFVAFAGWDACGAKWYGYPVFWLNRHGVPEEQLDTRPEKTGTNFQELLGFIQ